MSGETIVSIHIFWLCEINIATNFFLFGILFYFAVQERDQVVNNSYSYFSLTKSTDHLKSKVNEDIAAIQKEIQTECYETDTKEIIQFLRENWQSAYHIPYIPALSKPGWLLRFNNNCFVFDCLCIYLFVIWICLMVTYCRYIVGPHDFLLFQSLYCDFFAGITVAMTLIPQVSNWSLFILLSWNWYLNLTGDLVRNSGKCPGNQWALYSHSSRGGLRDLWHQYASGPWSRRSRFHPDRTGKE